MDIDQEKRTFWRHTVTSVYHLTQYRRVIPAAAAAAAGVEWNRYSL